MSSVATSRGAVAIAPAGRSGVAEVARLFRKSGSAVFGLVLVVVLGAAAVLAPLLAPHNPDTIDTARRLARPFTVGHPLGTDEFGRDLLSRLMYGARVSFLVSFLAVGVAALVGVSTGLLAGYRGGAIEFHIHSVTGGMVSTAIVGETRPGDRWRLSNPHGAMHVDRAGGDVLMVAGSTGLAPLRTLIIQGIHVTRNRNAALGWSDLQLSGATEVPSSTDERSADVNRPRSPSGPGNTLHTGSSADVLNGDA